MSVAEIVAFFQNAYAASQMEAEHAEDLRYSPDTAEAFQCRVRRLIARDSDNYTYKVVRNIFGSELCERIWWDNASPRWGWKSSHKVPADQDHILRVLRDQRPRVVIAFGKSASDALRECSHDADWVFVYGPHPAARDPKKFEAIRAMHKAVALAIAEPAPQEPAE